MINPLTEAEANEARLIAYAKLIDALPRIVDAENLRRVIDWLEARQILQDGQEDPGAVLAEGLEMELAIANAFMRMADSLGGR